MSQKIKKHYTGYNREILKEFMSEDELNELDRKYSEAKIKRLTERLRKETGV